jgi:hypothetical protein
MRTAESDAHRWQPGDAGQPAQCRLLGVTDESWRRCKRASEAPRLVGPGSGQATDAEEVPCGG